MLLAAERRELLGRAPAEDTRPPVVEHEDGAYGGAYARNYADQADDDDAAAPLSVNAAAVDCSAAFLLLPEDFLTVDSDSDSDEELYPDTVVVDLA